MRPMLSRPIDQRTLIDLAGDERWSFSQKLDGRRKLVQVEEGVLTAWNRSGVPTDLPARLATALKSTLPTGRYILDGELLKVDEYNHQLFLFDLPLAGELVTPNTPYAQRLDALQKLAELAWPRTDMISVLVTAESHHDKIHLIRRIAEAGAEGVIARRLDGLYRPGRRTVEMVKWKMIKEVDCVVVAKGTGGKDNLTVALYDGNDLVPVGEVTALNGDGGIIRVGDVVAIFYLYASDDRRLVQPTQPRLRSDKLPQDCTIDQLKYTSKEVLCP